MKFINNKKAVSPLVSGLVLIAMTILVGVVVYSIFYSRSSVVSSYGLVSLEHADLLKVHSFVFAVTLRNVGTKPITKITITLAEEDPVIDDLKAAGTPINPGETYSRVFEPVGTYIIGERYLLTILVEYSDGSTTQLTRSVTCGF